MASIISIFPLLYYGSRQSFCFCFLSTCWDHTNREVVEFIELVNKRPHNGDVDSHIAQLLQTQVVFHYTGNIAPYTVYRCVDGQVAVGVGDAAVYALVVAVVGVHSAEKRPTLGVRRRQCDAPPR